jgi:predicted enzyme related to lactoylglutathione lyase
MDVKLSHCFIVVDDQDRALAFYRDAVGLELRTDATMGNMRWLTVGPPSQPEIEIGLMAMSQYPGTSPADLEAAGALLAKGLLQGVIFATGDCDATFERIRQSGAEVLQEPIDQPYGVRDCAFRDPAGNMVRFSQRK